jgi:hypothetical protein
MSKEKSTWDRAARDPRSGFDRSTLLWCAIIGLALVLAIGMVLTSGSPELAPGAIPP